MLFAVSYRVRANASEESQKRALSLFAHWQPAAYLFKAHYANADGNGGLTLVETDSAAALDVHGAWSPFFEFSMVPIIYSISCISTGALSERLSRPFKLAAAMANGASRCSNWEFSR